MATDWAVVVIRIERAPDRPGTDAVLTRIQVSIGDREPELVGPAMLSRTRLTESVQAVLERICAVLVERD